MIMAGAAKRFFPFLLFQSLVFFVADFFKPFVAGAAKARKATFVTKFLSVLKTMLGDYLFSSFPFWKL